MSQPEYEAPARGDAVPQQAGEDIDYVGEAATVDDYPKPDWSEENPIPVYDVSRQDTPELIEWTASRGPVSSAAAVQLFGARRNRNRAVLYNAGPNSVYLGQNDQLNRELSYELAMGAALELTHNSAVYARCVDAETAVVSWLQEYTVSLDK